MSDTGRIKGRLLSALISSITLLGVAMMTGTGGRVLGQHAHTNPSGGKDGTAKASANGAVDYDKQIKPLLVARCYACHGNGSRQGGLQLDNRTDLLKGGVSGPAVVVGQSGKSLLVQLISGAQPGRIMPARGTKLTAAEVALVKKWIDTGLSFGNSTVAAAWIAPLAPRRPTVPAAKPGSGLTNPIDLLLQPYFANKKIAPKPIVDDATFARRAYMDTIGLLPPTPDLKAFLNDKRADKRDLLVARLLQQDNRYAEHWLTFWNDMLRNDYVGTGYIDGGRTQISKWLYDSLAENRPFDRFVAELVNPTPESAGFIKGIVWRGVVNASQTPEMQAAQNVSQIFLGINLKCASCHNSFISNWKLADAYGMASIFSEKPLELVRCDRPTGQIANIKFLYPELGTVDPNMPRAQRQARLASILTQRTNGRLARTFVNRLWAKLMGRGLVEPTDEMDNRPWNPDLLDWLASDFVEHGYDVRHTIRQIVTSRAYQMPAMGLKTEKVADFTFYGPVVKRMSAEQFIDGVATLTDVWPKPANGLRITKGVPTPPRGAVLQYQSPLMKSGSVDIDMDITGAQVLYLIATAPTDKKDLDWVDWGEPRLLGPKGEIPLTSLKWNSAVTGYGQIQINKNVTETPLRIGGKTFTNGIGAHADSVIVYMLPPGVTRFRATIGPDTGATEQKNSPTGINFYIITGDKTVIQSRASLAIADPLMRALDRPNREQVVTQRSTVATTLQALELTNGQTLADTLHMGAEKWSAEKTISSADLVNTLYWQALGRQPSATEQQAALNLVGTPSTKEGIEDLLWALVMLPEFQLIY